MSGGYIDAQGDYDHQIVTFTFKGKLDPANVEQWNQEIRKLKTQFAAHVVGITVKGQPTPPKYRK
jgi:hypothetical protein